MTYDLELGLETFGDIAAKTEWVLYYPGSRSL